MDIKEHNQKYINKIKENNVDMKSFQSWFDGPSSLQTAFSDVNYYILTPKIRENIPSFQSALEIGYGGGRLMNVVCDLFDMVYGVDIHEEQETTKEFLLSQNKVNFKLIKNDGYDIPIESSSIDFIYSFVVFQHFPSIDVVVNYIKEIERVLKPRGVGQIYYCPCFEKDYEVIESKVNYTSLKISEKYMNEICLKNKLRIIDSGQPLKTIDSGQPLKIKQKYIALKK